MSFVTPVLLWLLVPLTVALSRLSKGIHFRVHTVILILLVLAMARPVLEETLQKSPIQAQDILIALDVSYSMQASDISPTRYTFAKETINALMKENSTDNIMLIAFTTNPLILTPPTTDHALISMALESLNPSYILTKGTSLKKLFQKIATLGKGHRNLILITDGGEDINIPLLRTILEKQDITLLTLALGTKKGTTIQTQAGDILKDKEGNLVISRINPDLERLTKSLQGVYLHPDTSPPATASTLNHALQQEIETSHTIQKTQLKRQDLYHIPLLLALILFLMLHTKGVKYLLLLMALFTGNAQAGWLDTFYLQHAYTDYKAHDYNSSYSTLSKIKDASLQSQFLLGNIAYRMGKYTQAIARYKHIRSSNPRIKQMLYYNIANTYVHLGTYSKAKIYYTKALQLGDDKDARINLEHILFLEDKNSAKLGKSQPKSQSNAASKSDIQEESQEKKQEEQSGGGSGGGKSKNKKESQKDKLLSDPSAQKQPLGSKVYELINKGYIRETHPW